MKQTRKIFAMFMLLVCSLPMFTSCSEDESSTMYFTAEYSSYLPFDRDYAPVVEAILEYQLANGLIGQDVAVTKEGDITEDDYESMSKEAGERIADAMHDHDYNKVLQDAGISLSAPLQLTITYNVGISDMQGEVAHSLGTINIIYDLR